MNANDPITWSQAVEWLSDPVHAGLIGGALVIVALGFCSMFARAGFHWAFGLLMVLPGLNVLPFLALAYCSWPVNRELRSLRKLQSKISQAEQRFERVA